ncbi:hypothetical protein COO91_04243 [Nostoc flagelliforme CCNUN1]|uniref:Uncharacterized protein n=1 Tax=Nostoc flagelliforme CCNUN1 TaxID=2038116 RepID=A0A2K8SSA3_9NOSO|nr:hypothetical protein COO91_04243 [Nostoc flagelliforme CCNUN1]
MAIAFGVGDVFVGDVGAAIVPLNATKLDIKLRLISDVKL